MGTPEKYVLIDCDPGVDDCIAIMMMLAQSSKVKIVGITCANGNVGLRQVTWNALRILKLFDMLDKVPVFRGCDNPLVPLPQPEDACFYHGKDGLGDAPDVEPKATEELFTYLKEEHAVNAINRLSKEYAGRLQVLCIGPLTNLAVASKLDSNLPKRLKSLHILGGTIRGHGNITPSSEYNFFTDPEAAYSVLRCFPDHCPTQLLTFEVTTDCGIPPAWFYKIVNDSTKRRKFFLAISNLSRAYEDKEIAEGATGYTFCDAYLAAVVLDPAAVKRSKMVRVEVEIGGVVSRGSLIIDHRRNGCPHLSAPVEMIEELDIEVYKKLFESTFNE